MAGPPLANGVGPMATHSRSRGGRAPPPAIGEAAATLWPAFFFFLFFFLNKFIYLFFNKFIFFLLRWTRVAILLATFSVDV